MSSENIIQSNEQSDLLRQILSTIKSIQEDYRNLTIAVGTIEGRLNLLTAVRQSHDGEGERSPTGRPIVDQIPHNGRMSLDETSYSRTPDSESHKENLSLKRPSSATSRIILTTYPGQSGIDPLPMDWGSADMQRRGPVVVSRSQSTIRRRNGMSLALICDISDSLQNSNWCTWWFLFRIPCLGCREQKFGCRPQTRFYKQ